MQNPTGDQLTLYAEASLANRSAPPTPASEKAQKMTASSGRKCAALLKSQSPLGSLVRTLLESLGWRSSKWFLTWKPSGTKLRHRSRFRLVPSDTITSGRATGFLATPTATANQGAPSMQKHPGCRGIIVEPEEWERRMGYPRGWTDCECSETP